MLLSPVMIVGAVYLIGLEEELRFIGKWIGWVGEVEEKEQCGKKQEDKKEVDDEIQA